MHIHTPASHDYEQPTASYLDILKQAERRGLRIIAFTDHNTVNGYYRMMREIENLAWLEQLGRILPDEQGQLDEYRRLLRRILVLPGFEFTAAFGFHVLGIFPPNTLQRDIEHVLMSLRVPSHVLDKGLSEAGATADVLQAYRAIDEAGGIAIAAHTNSSNGVAMRGLRLGGQTRIAFTQDSHLHALEFTDLDKGQHSSAKLFMGTRPEYPRRMFILQGSDAHCVVASKGSKRLGVGDRASEIKLPEVSFEALRALFQTRNFDHVRPARNLLNLPEDAMAIAWRQGPGKRIAFHATLPRRNDRFAEVLKDICAMANGEGGDVFIGCAPGEKKIAGVNDPQAIAHLLSREIAERITPRLHAAVTIRNWEGAQVLQVSVSPLRDAPCALDQQGFFVRDGAHTRPATRDEIVALARRAVATTQPAAQPPHAHAPKHQRPQPEAGKATPPTAEQEAPAQPTPATPSPQPEKPAATAHRQQPQLAKPSAPQPPQSAKPPATEHNKPAQPPQPSAQPQQKAESRPAAQPAATLPVPTLPPPPPGAPRNGVQVLGVETRDGVECFTLRDLRNNSIIRDVTRTGARDLWLYAINQFASQAQTLAQARWQNDRALLAREVRAGRLRFDLAQRDANGAVCVFYGVTEEGLDEAWQAVIASSTEEMARNGADPAPALHEPAPG